MKKTTFICLALLIGLGLASCNNKDNADNKAAEDSNEAKFEDTNIEKDAEFATTAAAGGIMEVELGKIAVKNGGDDRVRKFADDMIKDHSAANEELKNLAASKNISLPTTTTGEQQKDLEKMREKEGEGFDYDYIDYMVKDHKKDIELFEKEAEKGNDPDLRSWAAGKLPTLRHHLSMAEELDSLFKRKNRINDRNGN
jgi:putative membrane protein